MKILKKKEWEKIKQQVVDLQLDLNLAQDDNEIYSAQVDYLQEQITNYKNENEKLACDLDDSKKEIKRLKALLTRNKVSYEKKEKANGTREA